MTSETVVITKNTRAWCGIYSGSTIKTHERHQRCLSGVLIVNYEQILDHSLLFLLTLNRFMPEILNRNFGTVFSFYI